VPASPIPATPSIRGRLLAAVKDGTYEEPTWIEVPWNGHTVLVGAHVLRAPLNGKMTRLGVSWNEQKDISKILGWTPPTADLSDAIWKAATVRLKVPWQGPVDMMSEGRAEKYNKQLDAQIPPDRWGELAADESKEWIWSNRLLHAAKLGGPPAANYGGRDVSGKPVQMLAADSAPTAHDASHYDYSQCVRPIKRFTKEGKDLVDVFIEQGISPEVFAGWR
jgi:hypothetical protein